MDHPTVKKSQQIDRQCGGGGAGGYSSQPGFFSDAGHQDYTNSWNPPAHTYGTYGSQMNNSPPSSSSRQAEPTPGPSTSTRPGSSTGSTGSGSSRVGKVYKNKDEKLAKESGIDLTINQIVGLPMDEFNDLLSSRHDLSEEQLNLCRDIRRRGKNKVAAQNCRRRKIDQVEDLETRILAKQEEQKILNAQDESIKKEHKKIYAEINLEINEYLRDKHCDPITHTLVRDFRGEIVIAPLLPNGEEPPSSIRPKKDVMAPDHPHQFAVQPQNLYQDYNRFYY